MPHGDEPTLKRVDGKTVKFCDTCKRQMKINNRCEWHTVKERCYYCHLILQHFSVDDSKEKKSSPKKSLMQKA